MNSRKASLITLLFVLCAFAASAVAQPSPKPAPSPTPRPTAILMVNYFKDKGTFEQTEQDLWVPLMKEVVKAGNLTNWSFWEVRWAAKNSEYDYVTVDAYKDWAAMEKLPYTLDLFNKAHPGKDVNEALKRSGEAGDRVRRELLAVMAQTTPTPMTPNAKYLLVEFWHVAPEKEAEYEKLLQEVYQPWRQEGVKQGKFSFWAFYKVLGAGSESPYNYVTARGYAKWENLGDVGGPDVFTKAHPKLKAEEVDRRTLPLRTLVKTHVLNMLESVTPVTPQP